MKYGREDLTYLKMCLTKDIIGLIGMIILLVIGLIKNQPALITVGVLVGGFILYQLIKTKKIIDEIENGKR